jgi:hypothetical protein
MLISLHFIGLKTLENILNNEIIASNTTAHKKQA